MDGRSHRAVGGPGFHEPAQPHTQAEDGATSEPSADVGCSVEGPVGGLNQPAGRVRPVRAPEGVQRGQRAVRGDFEDRATTNPITTGKVSAGSGGPVEVPVGGLYEIGARKGSVRAASFGAKVVKRGQLSSISSRARSPSPDARSQLSGKNEKMWT